jgi:hypothetical protein
VVAQGWMRINSYLNPAASVSVGPRRSTSSWPENDQKQTLATSVQGGKRTFQC